MDVSDLRRDVNALNPKDIFTYLVTSNAKENAARVKAEEEKRKKNVNHMNSQVDQNTDMSPEQLRQQAQMMRSMTPNQICQVNPKL